MSQTATTETLNESTHSLQNRWRLLFATGITIAGLGVLAVISPLIATLPATIVLGALLIVGAVVHTVHVVTVYGWKGQPTQAVLAVVYVLAGIALLGNSVADIAGLGTILSAFFLLNGSVELFGGLWLRPETNWQWAAASGAVSIVFAVLLWLTIPFAIAWLAAFLFGLNLITTGISMIGVALGGRNAPGRTRPSAHKPRRA